MSAGYDDAFVLMISTRVVSWDEAAERLARLRAGTLADVADWLEAAGEPAASALLRKWGVPDPGLNASGTDWAASFIPHGASSSRLLISESRALAEERVVHLRGLGFEAWLVARTWTDDEPSPWVGFDLTQADATGGAL
jgi:hypothetical protein